MPGGSSDGDESNSGTSLEPSFCTQFAATGNRNYFGMNLTDMARAATSSSESAALAYHVSPEIPPIQRAVLHRFRDMPRLDALAPREVGDRARHLEDAVVRAGGQG